jgi:serine kinase of HPr protein (carbohydrate metabolism regulator)
MASGKKEQLLHATCVAIDGKGALIQGDPGSGKSDLALRFITQFSSEGARLVADDQVRVHREGSVLRAESPENVAGLIEVRGLGIVETEHLSSCEIVLVVSLTGRDEIERMLPEPVPSLEIIGVRLPMVRLAAFEASAAAKLRVAFDLPAIRQEG